MRSDLADRYRSVSPEERERLGDWLGLWFEAGEDPRTLSEMAREIGREAQRNGLTAETLRDILGE